MENNKNEVNEYVTKKDFKKAVNKLNLFVIALAACLLYMWFAR